MCLCSNCEILTDVNNIWLKCSLVNILQTQSYADCGLYGVMVERSLRPKRLLIRISVGLLPSNNPGQAADTHVPLSQNSIIWYQPMCSDSVWLGR